MHEVELTGLDGGNLLGYLAALGTLRVLYLEDETVRMCWVDRGCWTPVVHHARIEQHEDLLEVLSGQVCPPFDLEMSKKQRKKGESNTPDAGKALQNANPAFLIDYLDLPLQEFGAVLRRECTRITRLTADFLAALGSDSHAEKGGDEPATTSLRGIGAGNNEGFLGYMRLIHIGTTRDHLRRALFDLWDYSDAPPFMRWDPNEFRPHALRATDPAKDRKHNNVRGANRLALEALPLFPVVPQSRRVRTVGFDDDDDITWPIWTEPLDLATVASLLAAGVTERRPGIAQVFRAHRFTEGKYRNFSPAKALL